MEKNSISCSRRLHFCAGHRVMNHESKCANVHGHNYVVWVEAVADQLDEIGRVIDFSVLKERVGGWIEQYWDHTILICYQDQELLEVAPALTKNKAPFVCPFNPTAENMADYLLDQVGPAVLRGTGVRLTKVTIYETENCVAEAREQ